MQSKRDLRNRRGASTIVLITFLAFFCILPLGLLGFEITRAVLAQQELRNITDSAALSGTAAMASAPQTDSSGNILTYQQRQVIAMNTALQTFQFNSILQTALNTAGTVVGNQNPVPPVPQTPAPHKAILNIVLLDQNGNQVATGQPAATLTVQSYWTDQPIWVSKLLAIAPTFTLTATSNGGLPQLDVILCLDVSGSMDDATNVWFVNRYWDTSARAMAYNTAVKSATGMLGHGNNLFTILNPPITGTSVNVYPPQNLADATYVGSGANTNGFTWSETPASGGYTFSTLNGLRSNLTVGTYATSAMPEAGMPPGNYTPGSPGSNRNGLNPKAQDASGGFTDLVCDMGFPTTVSYNGNSYTFTSVQTAVEAARGNMESLAVLHSACGGSTPSSISDTPQPGYFGAYKTWVLQNAAPIASARQAAYNFFNTMNLSANCHFGLICFSTSIGSNSTSVWSGSAATNYNLDASVISDGSDINVGGTGIFPNPLIQLNQTNTNAQEFTAVTQALEGNPLNTPIVYTAPTAGPYPYPIIAEGATDIADALQEAINELTNSSMYRPAAKKAIVLFTDGVPNLPGNSSTAPGLALAQGTRAGGSGVNIPIYTIGLSQNTTIQPQENALLGGGSSGGIASLSGNNAIYIPVTGTNNGQLEQAFQTIARSLCVIQ